LIVEPVNRITFVSATLLVTKAFAEDSANRHAPRPASGNGSPANFRVLVDVLAGGSCLTVL
jgi:hypothetical protein